MKHHYFITLFTLLLACPILEAKPVKKVDKVYNLSMGSPKSWLPIARLLYKEISNYIPHTQFKVHHYPHGRVLKDIRNKVIDGDIGWQAPIPLEFKAHLISMQTPLTILTMTVITNNPELFYGKDWQDLASLKIAFPRGASYVHKDLPKSAYNQVGYLENGFKMLKLGRVHGVMTTHQNFAKVLKKSKDKSLSPVKHLDFPIILRPVFHKDHWKLRDQVEKAIQKMRSDGVYNRIFKKTGIKL
jgi:hypothetical protein